MNSNAWNRRRVTGMIQHEEEMMDQHEIMHVISIIRFIEWIVCRCIMDDPYFAISPYTLEMGKDIPSIT